MNNQIEAFLDDLRSTHGDNLASVIMYGSAATGDPFPGRFGCNMLIALHRITPADLRNAHASVREWCKLGHPIPVYFTVSELRNAADVFPIEFHRMDAARKVLFGTDVLAGLTISDKFLRHQVEYELRSKLISLRRQYIPASASVEGLTDLMSESLTNIAELFGAVLLLHGVQPPATKREIIALTSAKLKLDSTVFDRIADIDHNQLAHKLDEADANRLFGEYLEQIETVIDSVDDEA